MKLRVGIVGLGAAWEVRHRPALRALSDRFEVRVVYEEVAMRAMHAADELRAYTSEGLRDVASRDDVDAILVLGTQWFGAAPILAACHYGKAVYWAAALDLTPQEALRVKQEVERAGIAFMAEFPRRHCPATLRLKELIATHLGRPLLIFGHARLLTNARRTQHRCQPTRAMSQDLIELVDWCRYVAGGEPTTVLGVQHAAVQPPAESDYRMMSLDFSTAGQAPGSGLLAHVSCGQYISADWPEASTFRPPAGLQVCCQNGVAFVDVPATVVWFDRAGRHMETLDAERPIGERMLSQFHRAVTSLVRRTQDLEDAYRAATVVALGEESFRQQRKLPVEFGSS